jgi:hypothetical protein
MSALRWGLVAAFGWLCLFRAAGVIHTRVVMKGRLSVQEGELVSRRYGETAGSGILVAGVATFLLLKSRERGLLYGSAEGVGYQHRGR